MPVPNLSKARTESDGRLVKFTPKIDGQSSSFVYDIELSYSVLDAGEAEVVQQTCPGVVVAFAKAQEDDNWKWSGNSRPASSSVVTVRNLETEDVAVSGIAEFRAAVVRASKKAVVLIVRLRFGGQSGEVASRLVDCLRSGVITVFEPQQQELFSEPSTDDEAVSVAESVVAKPKKMKASQNIPKPFIGDIVVGEVSGKSFAGILREFIDEDGAEFAKVDDFGEEVEVPLGDVCSFFGISAASGMTLPDLLKQYRGACSTEKVAPTWEALVYALQECPVSFTGPNGVKTYTMGVDALERAAGLLKVGLPTHGAQGLA